MYIFSERGIVVFSSFSSLENTKNYCFKARDIWPDVYVYMCVLAD
jgi:hypothetical protein